MEPKHNILTNGELAVLRLRAVYLQHGYTQYKMSKFEEYELYALNKDFLSSDNIIAFSDAGGKLMALKPDVTLSIVKNSMDIPDFFQKVYYDEQVYRLANGEPTFKEIRQTGIECIGEIDPYHSCEVLMLAARSLYTISRNYILDISHMGLVTGLIDCLGLSDTCKQALVECIGAKNSHGIEQLCGQWGVPEALVRQLLTLVSAYGPMQNVLSLLRPIIMSEQMRSAFSELEQVCSVLTGLGYDNNIQFDFSITSSMRYYNGLLFRGYVEGIPCPILSGGRYDKLMQKMGKSSGAIGFAVYLDLLERLEPRSCEYDTDVLLLYSEGEPVESINKAVQSLSTGGLRVQVQKSVPEKFRFRRALRLKNGRLEELETDG